MTKVIYTEHERDSCQVGEIHLTIRQIVRRLNRATKTRMHHRQPLNSRCWVLDPFTDLDGNLVDLLPPMMEYIHMLWLPDGREWDAVNGWRHSRGPKEFQEMLECLSE